MKKMTFQEGVAIVEISDHPEDAFVLIKVSKQEIGQDAQQVKFSRSVARAIGLCLAGDE